MSSGRIRCLPWLGILWFTWGCRPVRRVVYWSNGRWRLRTKVELFVFCLFERGHVIRIFCCFAGWISISPREILIIYDIAIGWLFVVQSNFLLVYRILNGHIFLQFCVRLRLWLVLFQGLNNLLGAVASRITMTSRQSILSNSSASITIVVLLLTSMFWRQCIADDII